jgi:hypothetical protein
MIYLIAYDLHNPGRDYDDVIATIKSATSWAHIEESVWLVDTTETTAAWRDKLLAAGDKNDTHFVARLQNAASWVGLSDQLSNWIKSSTRRW